MDVKEEWVKVFTPATIANLGPLFDVGGLAVRGAGNQVWARFCDDPGIKLHVEGFGGLSCDPKKNIVGVVAALALEMLGEQGVTHRPAPGIELALKVNIPVGSGLGSSASSAVAAAMAVNILCDGKLSEAEIIMAGRRGEQFASGSGHVDNIGPALLGGMVLAPYCDPDDFEQDTELLLLPIKRDLLERLHLTVVRPDIQIRTSQARASLKSKNGQIREIVRYTGALAAELVGRSYPQNDRYGKIRRKTAAVLSQPLLNMNELTEKYLRGTKRLVSALLEDNVEEVGKAVEQDPIITHIRAAFIKDRAGRGLYGPLKSAARENGAYGCSVCGSGPSIFAVTDSENKAQRVAAAMMETLDRHGTAGETFISTINTNGTYLLQ